MIKLNSDVGESFGIWKLGNDEKIFPLIDMANLACGFHASDALTMQKSVRLAKKHNVAIGAHISYQDLVGFGRRHMSYDSYELEAICIYQISALSGFCKIENLNVSYVKPHGALYNDMMSNDDIFLSIVKAISSYDKNIKLMILSTLNNDKYKKISSDFGVELIYEVFADRNYTSEGLLVSRNNENAVISDENTLIKRMQTLKKDKYLLCVNGDKLYLRADSICVHGDNENALNLIKSLSSVIYEN